MNYPYPYAIFSLMWVLKFNFSSKCIRRCFWHEVLAIGVSLKKIGWFSIVLLWEQMTFCACLVISGLNNIFQLKANSDIFLRSSFNKFADSVALIMRYHQQIILLMISNFQEDHWRRLRKVMVPVLNLEEHQLILVPTWNTDH